MKTLNLPEILMTIIEYLPTSDLIAWKRVNKEYNVITNKQLLALTTEQMVRDLTKITTITYSGNLCSSIYLSKFLTLTTITYTPFIRDFKQTFDKCLRLTLPKNGSIRIFNNGKFQICGIKNDPQFRSFMVTLKEMFINNNCYSDDIKLWYENVKYVMINAYFTLNECIKKHANKLKNMISDCDFNNVGYKILNYNSGVVIISAKSYDCILEAYKTTNIMWNEVLYTKDFKLAIRLDDLITIKTLMNNHRHINFLNAHGKSYINKICLYKYSKLFDYFITIPNISFPHNSFAISRLTVKLLLFQESVNDIFIKDIQEQIIYIFLKIIQ